MDTHLGLRASELAILLCLAVGGACWSCALVCAFFFRRRRTESAFRFDALPPVTLLKPVYGLEKALRENLRTACLQRYPEYQVVLSVQRRDDPAIPLLRELEQEFGAARVSVVIETVVVGMNGKINNLAGALPHARHDIIVISDSDVRLAPDFLRQIVAPLADPSVGAVSSFFRATSADNCFERLELLGLNADQFAMALLASATGSVDFCFGVSTALSQRTLAQIGGFEALGDTLVEDTEMGRRIGALGKRVRAIPHVVDVTVDLPSARAWASKQVYWEKNALAAVPKLFAAGFVLRIIPLGLVFATLRGWDSFGALVLAAATLLRLASAAAVLGIALGDREGLQALWLLPLKDLLSLVWAARALASKTVVWRGVELALGHDGRLAKSAETAPSSTEQSS